MPTISIIYTLLQSSVIFQGLITTALIFTTCYLWGTGQEVPNELWTANTVVIGFFFGSKAQQGINNRIQAKGGANGVHSHGEG